MRHGLVKLIQITLFFTVLCLQSGWVMAAEAMPNQGKNRGMVFPPDITAIQKRGVLKVAFYQYGVPPFFMRDASGVWYGIEVDLAQKIASQLGVKLLIVATPTFDGIINLVARDEVDMGMGLVGITPSRALRVSFTNPYYRFHPHLLVNRVLAAKEGWSTWNILDGMKHTHTVLKIGTLGYSGNIETVQETFPSAEIVPYADITDAMHDVIKEKLFAAVGDSPLQVQAFLHDHPDAVLQLSDVEIPERTDLIAIAVSWKSLHLREWLNNYFSYLQANNAQDQLLQQYGQ